jgi:hypothetical protein
MLASVLSVDNSAWVSRIRDVVADLSQNPRQAEQVRIDVEPDVTRSPRAWASPRTTRSKASNVTKSAAMANAVTPPAAEVLMSALVEAISGESLHERFTRR